MMGFVLYLLITLVIGCCAVPLSIYAQTTVGIFFDPEQWGDTASCMIAIAIGYLFMFGFAIPYWIYKLCIIGRR